MKTIVLFLTFCLLNLYSISQDTIAKLNSEVKNHRLGFSVNIIQLPINEIGLYIDYCYKQRYSIGIDVGYIYSNSYSRWESVRNGSELELGNRNLDRYPGFVYYGYVARLNYKYYFSFTKRKPFQRQEYIAFQVLYKSENYHNQHFLSVDQDHSNEFVRNENAYILGGDVIFGYHIISYNSKLNIEPFIGIGIRYRDRNYTTISSICDRMMLRCIPIGAYHVTQIFPMINVGFKIGFNTFL